MKKSREDKVINQFGLSNFSLRNRITVVLILFMLVVLGVSAYNNLPKESYPEVEQSTVLVGTPYPGNSPTDIENLITRPIEKEINTIIYLSKVNKPISINELQTKVWDYHSDMETHTVETHIYRLRKKIIDKFSDENFIFNNKEGYYLWKKEIKLQKIFLQLSIGRE